MRDNRHCTRIPRDARTPMPHAESGTLIGGAKESGAPDTQIPQYAVARRRATASTPPPYPESKTLSGGNFLGQTCDTDCACTAPRACRVAYPQRRGRRTPSPLTCVLNDQNVHSTKGCRATLRTRTQCRDAHYHGSREGFPPPCGARPERRDTIRVLLLVKRPTRFRGRRCGSRTIMLARAETPLR